MDYFSVFACMTVALQLGIAAWCIITNLHAMNKGESQ